MATNEFVLRDAEVSDLGSRVSYVSLEEDDETEYNVCGYCGYDRAERETTWNAGSSVIKWTCNACHKRVDKTYTYSG